MQLPAATRLHEVGPRDGLQSHDRFIPTDVKVAMVDRLSELGFPVIEVTSFAHPDVVPHLRDAEAVMSRIERVPGTVYRALAPNERGARRAIEGGADAVLGLVTVSEEYNQRNQNRSVGETIDEMARTCGVVGAAGLAFTMAVGMAFHCPFEGRIAPARTADVVGQLADVGVRSFYFAGSLGLEDPVHVASVLRMLRAAHPDLELGFHLHDLGGFGLANALAALDAGADFLESSICGLGGGMHVPTGSNNVATEDLVHLLAACGVATGLDPAQVTGAATEVGSMLDLTPRSKVTSCGVRPDLVGLDAGGTAFESSI